MSRRKIHIYSRPLRYIYKEIIYSNEEKAPLLVGDEKGIDVRIAIDMIRLVSKKKCDIALIFSQDQDLSEVADEIRNIAREQGRWIKIASAFPRNLSHKHLNRGIDKTDWISFDKTLYDTCLDSRDYRPRIPA